MYRNLSEIRVSGAGDRGGQGVANAQRARAGRIDQLELLPERAFELGLELAREHLALRR